jgi:hypothetical protein
MKKSNIYIILTALTALFFAGCNSKDQPVNNEDIEDTEGWEVIGDIHFKNGLAVSPLHPRIVTEAGGFEKANTDTVYFEKQDVLPVWQMCQWYSKYDLAGAQAVKHPDNSIAYSNQGKKIVRYADGSLLLDITTSTEYEHPRRDEENWPHLLIQQDFPEMPVIGKVEHLNFSIQLQIVKCENKMEVGDFNANLHTAQSPFYFILRNNNKASEDYNASMWFGIPSFDYRYTGMSETESISWDTGTGMYIYNVPQKLIWGNISFQDEQWHKAEVDILPLIIKAVSAMKTRGLFQSTRLSDLVLTGMNFGWEVPGTFDAAIVVKEISLKVVEN